MKRNTSLIVCLDSAFYHGYQCIMSIKHNIGPYLLLSALTYQIDGIVHIVMAAPVNIASTLLDLSKYSTIDVVNMTETKIINKR